MSSPVTAQMVKELRDRTGVGMGKCKEALEEAKGDMELAIANLRKSGMAAAVKKEGRATNEGMIATAQDSKNVGVIEINAETDFVVRNTRFQEFLREMAEEIVKTTPASLEAFLAQTYSKDPNLTIDQYRSTVIQTIGENIQIRRITLIPKGGDKSVGIYSHMGGKIVCIVEIQGSNAEEELARDIAMHVAAAAPEYLDPASVPAEVISHEKEIARGQVKGKPENIVEKILEGKITAYYDAVCLVRQKFIKNDELHISDLVAKRAKETGKPLVLTSFIRWNVGQ